MLRAAAPSDALRDSFNQSGARRHSPQKDDVVRRVGMASVEGSESEREWT
jgi:hypothetical protein